MGIKRYDRDGVPTDPNDWCTADWRDLFEAWHRVREKVAARHVAGAAAMEGMDADLAAAERLAEPGAGDGWRRLLGRLAAEVRRLRERVAELERGREPEDRSGSKGQNDGNLATE